MESINFRAQKGNSVKLIDDIVIKKQPYENHKREISALKLLDGNEHFPQLIEYDDDGTFSMSYCGQALDALPQDWRDQAEAILTLLVSVNLRHRDIVPRNLLIKDDIIKLIDFSWSGPVDEEFTDYPGQLGLSYKSPKGFDDRFSLYKCLEEKK